MGELDITFRRALRELPRPILRLAFPGHELEPLGPLDPSVDRPRQRTVDSLFQVRDGKTRAAVYVEIERDWRPGIPARLFECASAATVAAGMPVWTVVVLLRKGGRPPNGTGEYRIPGPGYDTFEFRYQVVPLWQLDARHMRTELGLQGAPFCVAMQGADEQYVRELAEEVIADRTLPRRDRKTTIELLYYVSAAIFGAEPARRIFSVESLIQDPNVQELISGWKNEGRASEARRLLYKVLAARSFSISDDVRARIDREPDITRLEAWHETAVTAAAIRDVFRDG